MAVKAMQAVRHCTMLYAMGHAVKELEEETVRGEKKEKKSNPKTEIQA